MEATTRCQSCGMPLGLGFFGSEVDGTSSQEYCKFCWQKGQFVEPDLQLQDMIDRSVQHMHSELQFSEDKARQIAEEVIPQLGRWHKVVM